MKRKMLQIGSLLMAFYVLFVAHGLNVNFHFCTENHHVTSSFGDASRLCEHCMGHHHHEQMDSHEFEEHLKTVHFGAKCCCEDYVSEIGFTDNYTFSTEKPLMVFLPSTAMTEAFHLVLEKTQASFSRFFTEKMISYLLTGRLKTIFFSNLKLNPLPIELP